MKINYLKIGLFTWLYRLLKIRVISDFVLSLILTFSFTLVFAQPGTKSFIDINAMAVKNSFLDEKVLLISDRKIYLCGENIVFEAFTYEANWFLPVVSSSILYVELYNQQNIVISKNKYFINNGSCSGVITIPRDINSDVYYLRAYSNYMKNFGVRQFFTQKLKIVNPFLNNPVSFLPSDTQKVIGCQIFPEGGDLVSGVKSKVGCRFTDQFGKGVEVSARVIDTNNITITSFKTYRDGFGSFNFTPMAGVSYLLEANNGWSKLTKEMPTSLISGSTISIDTLTTEFLRLRISSTENKKFPLRLDATHDGFVYPLIDTLINSAGHYEIPAKKIPVGLICLKLTDFEGKSLANRFLFKDPVEKFKIDLKTDKESYNNRENVDVMISARNGNGDPVKTNLMIFVSLLQKEGNESDKSFPSETLLNQELKQLFFCDNDLVINASTDKKLLDMVLLYNPLLSQKSPGKRTFTYLPEIRGDIISGKLEYQDKQPAKGIEILQSFIGKTNRIESSVTDFEGKFNFLSDTKNNNGDLILKVQDSMRETSIIPDDEFFSDFPPASNEIFSLTKEEIELISKEFINIQVDDAFSAVKKGIPVKIEQDEPAFYGKEFVEYKFPDYLKLPNMEEFIFEVIEGVIISKENKKTVIRILEKNTLSQIGPNPLILIDGIPVTESSLVVNFPSEKVQDIRVVRNKYFYKDQVFDGVLDIITYSKDASSFDFPRGTFRYSFDHPCEKITLIESKLATDIAGRVPVYKNLLYWNSDVTTDKDGKTKVMFITPDNNGTFEIRCLCLTEEGIAGEGLIRIKVGE